MLKRLFGTQFVRNVSKLVLGAGLGQVVGFFAAPFIARMYGPESFGEQSAIFSIAGPIAALTSLAFPIAIVVAPKDYEALALYRMAFWGSLTLAPIATALILINDSWVLHRLGLQNVGAYIGLIPIIVVLSTMNMSAGYIMSRSGAYGLSARASVAAAVIGNLSKLGFGFISPGTFSLIAGNALGYIVAPIMSARLRKKIFSSIPRQSLAELKRVANSHCDFPFLRAPQNFISALSQSLPIIGLTAGFGPESAGQFAIALAIAGAPIMLIGNATQTVLYPRLTAAVQDNEDTSRLFLSSTLGLLAIGSPIFVLIAMFGPSFFEILLGTPWREAGVYCALLVPWLWLGLANRPAVALIPALKLQRGLLIYEIIVTLAKMGTILIGLHVLESARWTVGMFSGVGAFAYSILIFWVYWSSRKKVG